MVTISSNTLVAMASQLSEAEERERAFSGRGRWNQLRSMAEAKSLLQYIFNVAADARLVFILLASLFNSMVASILVGLLNLQNLETNYFYCKCYFAKNMALIRIKECGTDLKIGITKKKILNSKGNFISS